MQRAKTEQKARSGTRRAENGHRQDNGGRRKKARTNSSFTERGKIKTAAHSQIAALPTPTGVGVSVAPSRGLDLWGLFGRP